MKYVVTLFLLLEKMVLDKSNWGENLSCQVRLGYAAPPKAVMLG